VFDLTGFVMFARWRTTVAEIKSWSISQISACTVHRITTRQTSSVRSCITQEN